MPITFLESGTDATQGFQAFASTSPDNIVSDAAISKDGPRSIKFISDANRHTPTAHSPDSIYAAAGSRTGFWIYLDSFPASTDAPVFSVQNSSDGRVYDVVVTTAGVIRLGSFGGFLKSGSTLATGTWYFIWLAHVIVSSSNFTVKLFLNDALDITITNADLSLANANPSHFEVGWVSDPGQTSTLHLDSLYVDDGSGLDSAGLVHLTSKLPTTANANNFDTTGGSGAVNERPLSQTNYRQQAATSQVAQNYAIETAAGGDVDVSGATIVGYGAWIWAKGTTGGLGTPKITRNGTDVAIVLTASPAMYTSYATSASYPSNAATVGMVSTGDADDTFLYECGMLIAYTPSAPPAYDQGAQVSLGSHDQQIFRRSWR